MKRLIVSAASNVGYVRTNNEDMILAGNKKVRDSDSYVLLDIEDDNNVVVAVADGMGGYDRGEVASEKVIESLSFCIKDLPRGLNDMEFYKCMNEWVVNECRLIESMGRDNPSMACMGTTLVALVCYGGCFYTINCGDSRLYRMRDDTLTQLTMDHTPEAQRGFVRRSHSITNCIGGGCPSTYLDIENITERVLPNDIFLLCSDGLTDMISDVTIASVLRMNGGLVNAKSLVDSALSAGGGDNVSVCLAKFENNID